MSQLNDCQFDALEALGYTTGTLNDRLYAWLLDLTGLTTGTLNDLWYAMLTDLGYTGTLNDMQVESWVAMGATSEEWNDAALYFWCDLGGVYGPNVSISLASGGSCTYEPPGTTDCTATATYTANDSGFTNPADTWLWSLEPPVAGIVLTDTTLQTCTVETQNFAVDTSFNLKVVATDSVSTDSATRTTTFTQDHTDTNTIPAFIGPVQANLDYFVDDPINPIDSTLLFTGTNLVFTAEGTLPTGLTYIAGLLDGTATVVETQIITYRATNSKGLADSNTFSINVTSGETFNVINGVNNVVNGADNVVYIG